MSDQTEQHTPGPLAYCGPYEEGAYLDGGCLITTGYDLHEPEPEVGIFDGREPLHSRNYGFKEGDARLLVAAYTSYDRHFGPSAVSAAEGDKLGEAIEIIRCALVEDGDDCWCAALYGETGDEAAECWQCKAKRLLASLPTAATRQED